jgi:hypothetical protein
MTWDKSTRMKLGLKLRRIQWLLTILVVGLLLTQNCWQSAYHNWRCGHIAAELSEKYGIIVRYGDPSEFYVPPLAPLVDIPENGFMIGRSDVRSAHTALVGVRDAISKYPTAVIQKNLSAVFISGIIKSHGTPAGGSYFYSWIYLSAIEDFENLGFELYAENFHHELSSLLLKNGNFPSVRWHDVNEPGFKYLSRQIDVIRAAAPESRRDPKDAPSWFRAGFVHDYGMSSMNNDFNMYAVLAMAHPQRLKELAQEYPKIKAKTQILVEFYTSLAPELGAYFKSVGLADLPPVLPPAGHLSPHIRIRSVLSMEGAH